MDRTIFANLRNTLATLYPDERSIRRIADDSGIDLSHIILNAHAKNDWHAVLTEANKNNQVGALLTAVEGEYSGNKQLGNICQEYRVWQNKNGEAISGSSVLVNEK